MVADESQRAVFHPLRRGDLNDRFHDVGFGAALTLPQMQTNAASAKSEK
jgi:hypothetical protein